MSLKNHLETVRERIRRGLYTSEATVSQGIVLPTLHGLGWPVFDPNIVIPEFSIEGRRVDYALCHPANKPTIFIEVKKIGSAKGAERQLFEYAFHLGVPMAILTDGQEWSFYLPGEQGRYEERRVYKLDLLERSLEEVVMRLTRYLEYKRVTSGESLHSAREDYKDIARNREIEAVLPSAWSSLLNEPDSLLPELLADKVEDLCGYKPDLDTCSRYLERYIHAISSPELPVESNNTPHKSSREEAPTKISINPNATVYYYIFEGKRYEAKTAREVMENVFKLIASKDPGFLERFASRKHGKKRHYIAANKYELYPDRPDLAETHSTEITPGWWLGTNYSRKGIQKILNLALEVIDPQLRSAIEEIVL